MITVSLCMIVKNEQDTLEKCLRSVYDLVDEINIVDTGSTDQTISIAKKYTDRVFHFPWTGKFKDARNHSFAYATKDYILYLDADDVLLDEDRHKFRKLKQCLNKSVDSVSMFYQTLDDYGNILLIYRRNRLVKRERNFLWHGDAHNYLKVDGDIYLSDIAVTHNKKHHQTGRTLQIYQSKLRLGDTLSARDYFYFGNELRENGMYKLAIEAYTKHLSMNEGWADEKLFSCIFRADCYEAIHEEKKQISSLLESFMYTNTPRPETCCRIGLYLQKKRHYLSAIWWYKLALRIPYDKNHWGFTYRSYATWYPHLQLFQCYYNLQQFDKAARHNKLALSYRPGDPQLLFQQNIVKNLTK